MFFDKNTFIKTVRYIHNHSSIVIITPPPPPTPALFFKENILEVLEVGWI